MSSPTIRPMTFGQARAFADSLATRGMDFGLERMSRLLEALDHPERRFPILHVAGTNGKGSTCAFAASILRATGRKVGLYTSPHLERPSERIRVNFEEIPDEAFAAAVSTVLERLPEVASGEFRVTYFEFETAVALLHFAREGVEAAVLETGLGGRLDATNAVEAACAVVTRVGLDHTALLGETLEAIALEKAGIFRKGRPVVVARQPVEALEVLRREAAARGCPLSIAGEDFALIDETSGTLRYRGRLDVGGLRLGLFGKFQRENAETAIEAVRRFLEAQSSSACRADDGDLAPARSEQLQEAAIRRGLAEARWPGRMELIREDPPLLLDGAHNPDAARALVEAVDEAFPAARVQLVFGVLADKDCGAICDRLFPRATGLWLVPPSSERALSLDELGALAAARGRAAHAHANLGDALDGAIRAARADHGRGMVVVAGSLYLVGAARRLLSKPEEP